MTLDARHLIDGYFDEQLTEDEHIALNDWVKADPEHARVFARAAQLHDQLHNMTSLGSGLRPSLDDSKPPDSAVRTIRSRTIRSVLPTFSVPNSLLSTAASMAALLIVLTVLWFNYGSATATAAVAELDRIIASSKHSKDRTYKIVVEDVVTPPRREQSSAEFDQRPPKPPLDGATLHVREGQQFVLIRFTKEGSSFITGSNGRQSWAVNTKGPVRVSSDIHHFDHDLPGHETSIPLTNLQDGLEKLKQSYDLQFSTLGPEESETYDADVARLLMAIKKPKVRGPQRVEIAYDSKTGRILHMRFVQMPYGPERLDLRLSLIDEHALPVDFFEHTSHHTADRKVEMDN